MDRNAVLGRVLKEEGAGAALISSRTLVRWLTGFTGSSGMALARPGSVRLITDGRYEEQARQEAAVAAAIVTIADTDPYDYLLKSDILEQGLALLVQPDHLTGSQLDRLRTDRPQLELLLREGLLRREVAQKDPWEVDRIRKAQEISEEVLDYLLGWVMPGMCENEVAAELVYQHLKRGADRMAFDPIVASGPNSAMPHARPGERIIERPDVLLMDFGCVWQGYSCDMTRTVSVGDASDKFRRVFGAVGEAQHRAIAVARAGIPACRLDAAARTSITDAGFGDFFTHGTGHGVGLEIHEWPRISRVSEERLPLNTVVTVEPGVYLPGEFGVRLEDMVLLTADGCQNLTNAPGELIEL